MIQQSATQRAATGSSASHEPQPVACAASSQRLLELARRVAASECTVLIVGESGTGKEVLARFIHGNSTRWDGAFIAVNCAAIPEHMLEAILFGYERGAFTGAHSAHAGKFEQAQGGTLLLDEITEMPLALQAKLLRVLQEREVERLGSGTAVTLDVRVLATTNRRLREEVAAGRFREDLYYRLNVFPLALAPLRQRRDDILPLAMQLLGMRSRPGASIPALSAAAAQVLLTYPWPGNVRELDNLLQRALILVNGPLIAPEHIQFELPPELAPPQPPEPAPIAAAVAAAAAPQPAAQPAAQPADASLGSVAAEVGARTFAAELAAAGGSLADSLDQVERDVILEALRGGGGTRREAAERLGISPRTLRYKLARLRAAGVDIPAF